MAENKYLVAWAHFPIVFGPLVPLAVWLMNRDKDKNAAFQAKQALVWQVAWSVVLLVWMFVGGLITFAMFGSELVNTLFLAVPVVALLLIAVCALYAALGAIRMLQGKGFAYPVIGAKLK